MGIGQSNAVKDRSPEYKDYILGFIFYKYLSDKQLQSVKNEGMSHDEIKALNEEDKTTVEYIQKDLGYFIFSSHKLIGQLLIYLTKNCQINL